MEEINNTNTANQPIETLPIQPITPKTNLFKYLFIVCFTILLIVIISFIFILNNKNSKQSPIKQNTSNTSEVTPTDIPTSVTTPQQINNTPKPTIAFNDSKLIQLGYKVNDYNINNVTKNCNPCTKECTNRTVDEQNKITSFYSLLKEGSTTGAASFLKNYIYDSSTPNKISFLGTIFPICSSSHSLLGVATKEKGILVFITSGNGYPSVPNDTYYFGYITTVNNTIKLYEKLIEGYFNDTGDSYNKALNSNDFKTAINILDSQSNDVAKSMSSGIFSNKNIQQEFNQLINSVK
ncbi:MAG: hypothetical protein PHP97_00205 [Candidatus Shapirobacteria bacterium]|nr:hypothetical protein [Candidatus Shapirobacteria bacterium]MDD3002446.1 hypothetical protein [Candidatus Shapirobacteria bacterium]MDD4383365.1 hypothetical protein [Candidatus Shapirobacteria bacterium]